MANFEIKHRYTDNVLFACEAENMRDAVQQAVNSDANLIGANLRGANLIGANLRGANLIGANLIGANFSDANLIGANLIDANLIGANLSGAYLRGANLSDANLRDANFSDANLIGANFSDANLIGANLIGANLRGEILAIAPITICGIYWNVLITESYLTIGCQRHTHEEWKAFDDENIAEMHSKANEFWTANKSWLLGACKSHKKASLAHRKTNEV
jgi:hypothetical protein